jgi:putative transcriptional regulator
MVGDAFGLTATVDILRAIADGAGPQKGLLALGYAGWAPGQLDSEIQANGWLNAPADPEILFDDELDTKWERALGKVGVDVSFLSTDAGHA